MRPGARQFPEIAVILHLEELMLWRRTFLFDVDNTLLATAVTSPLGLIYSR